MLLSQVIALLREELTDPAGGTNQQWSDAELGRIVSAQSLIMVRRQVAIDEAYHNHRFTLLEAAAVQRSADVWAYYLPHWCGRIVEVRFAQDTDEDPRKRVIRHRTKFGDAGWRYSGRRVIELARFSQARDITITCAKRPARLTKGTLPTQAGMLSTQLRLDADTSADALIFPHETQTDAYANGVFEITGVNDVTDQPGGQIRSATASAHLQIEAGALYTVLTLDQAWTTQPVAGDTYEMHPEIDDDHLRLLILLCARAAWTRKGNRDEVRASEMELHQEWQEFQRHMQPRDIQEPKIIAEALYPEIYNSSGRSQDDGYWDW